MKQTYNSAPTSKRVIAWVFVLLLATVFVMPVCTSCNDIIADQDPVVEVTEPTTTSPIETEPELEITEPVETEPAWEFVELPEQPEYPDKESFVTIYDVSDAIQECESFIVEVETIKESLDPEHPQLVDVDKHLTVANENLDSYNSVLNDHWSSREKSRPVMTKIWNFLTTDGGFSPEVTAGIIGNMCAESGGRGYDDIDPKNWDDSTGKSYYGICQWSVKYNPSIANKGLNTQLKYLVNTYEKEFKNYGYKYSDRYGSKFRTAQFENMKDPYEAAIAFAVCYERCSSKYVEMRGPLANKAYKYFTVLGSWPWPGSR